jgi:hypothetical protein
MKYICLGYFAERQWKTMSETEQNACTAGHFTQELRGCFAFYEYAVRLPWIVSRCSMNFTGHR